MCEFTIPVITNPFIEILTQSRLAQVRLTPQLIVTMSECACIPTCTPALYVELAQFRFLNDGLMSCIS